MLKYAEVLVYVKVHTLFSKVNSKTFPDLLTNHHSNKLYTLKKYRYINTITDIVTVTVFSHTYTSRS